MPQEQQNFLDELGLGRVIENAKTLFAKLSHSHKLSDISDYKIDTSMSSSSTNPVQNKTINSALSSKVPTTRTINGKPLSSNISLTSSDVGAATPTQVNNVQTNLNAHADNIDVHITEQERTKLTGIEEGAQRNTVTGVKGNSESSYRTGNINITKANIGLSNVDNTSDINKPVSTAQQTALNTHNTNTSAHNDIRLLIEDLNTKLMNFLDLGTDESVGKEVIDSVSELVGLYEKNADLISSITTSKVNVSDIVNNLTTASTSKVLSANQGVEIKKLIDALQTVVNGKSDSEHTHDDRYYTESEINTKLSGKANTSHGNHVPTTETANNAKFLRNDNTWQTVTPENIGAAKSSHGTHVSYSSTAPVMDGTASVGSASTVARSDHKHPIDTSRASKTEFDTHTSDTTKHITSAERTSWNSAKAHASSAHAPSDAQKNQNAFSNIKVGDTTISADTTTDTLTLVGSNVTITPDTTNDKVTIAVASGSTSTKGIVQLTNSTSSTSTTTAATPNSVKSAYDLANTAKTKASTAQTKADSAYTLAESKVDSLSDLGITATATELNYMDGVTSNIQTQLDGKIKNNPFNGSGTSGEKGYIAFAQLKITQTHTNRPIEFELICRGKQTPCYVSIVFSNSDTTDPSIESLRYWGSDYGIFAVKSTTSTWLLYHTKSEAYDNVTIARIQAALQGITITYPGSFITTKPTSGVTNASLGGSVNSANSATSATKATQDASGNVITSTYETKTNVSSHTGNKSNPHGVTKSQVGLENVPNVATNNQTPTFSQASSRVNIASGEKLSVILGKVMKWFADLKTVAFTGNYNDLSNKPTIPSAYTHPTSSGNKHIPSGGKSGQILRWSADGTSIWDDDTKSTAFLPTVISKSDYTDLGTAVNTNNIFYLVK